MKPHTGYRYGKGLILIHWATAILMAAAIALVYSADFFDDSRAIVDLHRSVGLLVLVLGVLRLMRKLHEPSWVVWDDQPLQKLAARLTHQAIYLLLILVPVLGLLQTMAKGKPFLFFGAVEVPSLIAKNRELADTLQGWHENLALVFVGLIGLHVAAALFHRFVKRDGVLYAMLPIKAMLPGEPAPAPITDGNETLPALNEGAN